MECKKVLIVTYYWPPAGGPGVQRWLKFAKYLPEFGWEPIVYTAENPSYPLIDRSLEKEIPENLKVIKTKIWEPYQLAEKLNRSNKKFKTGQFDIGINQNWRSKLSIWIRGNFFIPDARVFWVRPSVRFIKKYLLENQVDALVTTGPPHSLHLIGLGIKKIFPDLKWVADFRDPWTEISYYKHLKLTKWADKKHKSLEQQIFDTADIILATSFTDAEHFREKGANVICITNGFDEDDFQNQMSLKTQKFVLSYIGVLEQLRNPKLLWNVLEEIIKENQNFSNDFELKIVGKIDNKILEELKGKIPDRSLNNLGYLSHYQALDEMKKSNVLLITNFNQESSKGIIPGKLFEYLATGKQIISFGPRGGDVSKILTKTQQGKHFEYNQKREVKDFICELYQKWKQNGIEVNKEGIEQYSRRKLTKELAKIL